MAGRPEIFEEQVVIDKAIEVFWTNGYEADLAEELLKGNEYWQNGTDPGLLIVF